MSDIYSKSKRSDIMSKISGKETKPEILVRKYLFLRNLTYIQSLILSMTATFSIMASIFAVKPLRMFQYLFYVFTFSSFEVFLRLPDVEIVEGNHHIEIEKIVSLNSHFLPPDFPDIFSCVKFK